MAACPGVVSEPHVWSGGAELGRITVELWG